MSNNKDQEEALQLAGISCDSGLERGDRLDQRLHYFRRELLAGKSHLTDRPPDVLALDALDALEKVLRFGCPSRDTLLLLADFMRSVLERSDSSATAWDEEVKLVYRILGHKPNGRPPTNKGLALERAVDAFDVSHNHAGDPLVHAERKAHDAYRAVSGHPERTYERESRAKVPVAKGANVGAETNRAEQLLENVIRPELRRRKLIAKKTPGPKPRQGNSKSKPHP